jgi:hypothetical protein
MGKRTKRAPKAKRGVDKRDKARKLTSSGRVKRKRGDMKMVNSMQVGYQVKQKKGGQWVKAGERKCKIHTVCNCVVRTDPSKMKRIANR